MKKTIAAAGLSLFLTQVATAETYGSVSYALFETEIIGIDFDTPTLQFAVGNQFDDNWGVELRFGVGTDEDRAFGLDMEISQYYALYLKPTLPLANNVSLYALLGVANTEVDTSVGEDDDSDISYGFGIAAEVNPGVDLFGEYISLYDDTDDGISVEIKGFNIGVGLTF